MKRKKLLSTAVAGMLVAAQMVMPVAAADGGEVDVDVTTRTAVIRVEVPTTLAIAVNQFEKGDTGSQIYSEAFGIKNKSEIPVKVSVTSTATLDNAAPVTLVSTKSDAEDSEAAKAWVAVAALTSAGKYIEESGKDIGDLTEASENVTTFVQGTEADTKDKATADQVFYLAAEATPTVTYQKVAPTDADELAGAKKISYAQFYELTALSLTGGSEQGDLDAAIAAGDVYKEASDGTITLIEKGTSASHVSGEKYYTVDTSATPVTGLAVSNTYVYGEAGDGGVAGFRYIGKLSEGKENWTADDIVNVNIKYDITGVTGTRYDEVKDDCTYGLYLQGPDEVEGTNITNGGGSTIYDTPAKLASQMKAYSVVFRFDTAATDISDLEVTKIVVDGNTYEFTKGTASNTANSDGKSYTLKNFTANTATEISVYYGDSYVIQYDLTPVSSTP